MSNTPHFGHTRHGLPVHLHTADYNTSKHGQLNQKIALWMNSHVMTMRCFWLFCVIACLSLPAALHLAGIHLPWLYGVVPAFALTFGWIQVDAWVTQNFIQLVLLPALGVGQNLQNAAADARAAKQFEDLETVKDWLNLQTQGGLADVLKAVEDVHEIVAARSATTLPPAPTPKAPAKGART